MKQFISRTLILIWGITTLYGLWFLQADRHARLILFLSSILCFSLVWRHVASWSSRKLLVLLGVLEGVELAGLGVVGIWVNHSGLVPVPIWLFIADLLGAIFACVTRWLFRHRNSDWLLAMVCGGVASVLAITCVRYNTLDQFLSQRSSDWYIYLALVAPFAYITLVGLVFYLVHSFRLVVDELIFHESF